MKKIKRPAAAAIIVIALLAVYIFVSVWISYNYIVVREYAADTGKNKDDLKIAVISDLHDHRFGGDNKILADKIIQTDPDVIIMDGDMLNADSKDTSVPVGLIQRLKDTAPVYYALGNHEIDYMKNNHAGLTEDLEDAGATVLDKKYVDIEIDGIQIRLGGMYDYAFGLNGNNDAAAAPSDVKKFLIDFQDTDRLKIMLSHRPDSFVFGDASKAWDIDIVISGHNHGGQVVVPFKGGLYGGDQGWFPEYVHGVYKRDNIYIFVTSGLGSDRQKLPRFNNPPEIAVLSIK